MADIPWYVHVYHLVPYGTLYHSIGTIPLVLEYVPWYSSTIPYIYGMVHVYQGLHIDMESIALPAIPNNLVLIGPV
jgi:hypothetical protein